ncbi:uncharacterized protein BYT42DRAFT_358702 [Radiomyces spectabilis]|uniref:uncharacterized protein n=1 Tax=Radiomyces spectabilis TaxID=64574 RepID=UPI00222079B4|nr:uncharacterized protein BYT42DRAFT_358702 [Radiomyces spectabilis]KAI8377819.1 hypothetical protein BYT42DRAFT_358702 [Radiomyces spectabilis]
MDPAVDTPYRKIDLDTINELYFQIGKLRKACNNLLEKDEVLNKAELKNRIGNDVSEAMDQWISNIFYSVAGNLTIGGDNCDKNALDLDAEPYEESLKQNAESAEKLVKDLLEEVIQARCNVPTQMASLMNDALSHMFPSNDQILYEKPNFDQSIPGKIILVVGKRRTNKTGADFALSAAPPEIPVDEVSRIFRDSTQILAHLEKTVPEQVAENEQLQSILQTYFSNE